MNRTKVLFFRPTLGDGGADRVTITVLKHLDRSRFEPELALMRAEGASLPELPADVPLHDLGSKRLRYATAALIRTLRNSRPDVLFSTSSSGNVIAAMAALAVPRMRLVLSERSSLQRGESKWSPRQNAIILAKKLLYRRANAIAVVSQGVADEITRVIQPGPDKIRVVYNPLVDDQIDSLAAQPVTHPWFAENVPVVLACGRLVPVKDYATLLEAFGRLRRQFDARLYVLGEGPMRGELEQRASSLGLAQHVAFAGFDKNPFRYFARARLMMHASRVEGMPGALVQAMACGAPVVSTDCDYGPREVIRDGVDGFLTPVGDADALAVRAASLLSDRAMRDRFSMAARQGAERFTVTASQRRYEAAIEGS